MPNNITVNTASVLTPQISMNAKLPRVMPLPPAPTHQVPMSATAPVVIREMTLTVKVKYLNGSISKATRKVTCHIVQCNGLF